MRILHVIPTYLPAWRYGGPVRSVHGLAVAQATSGDQVTVFTTCIDGDADLDQATPSEREGVEIRYFAASPPRRLARSVAMGYALRAEIDRFDVVHLHSVFLWPTLAAARAAARAGVPYVVSPRGMLVDTLISRRGWLRKRAWLALFERRTLAHAGAIVLTSEIELRALVALGLALAPTAVIPNGFTPEDVAGATGDDPPAELAHGQPLIAFIGRVSWKKGLDVAIAALALVPSARLAIAGNDDEGLRPKLEQLAASLGVGERVTFLGELRGPAKQKLLAMARALVLPSLSENFGNAALEAMAAGLPVVLTTGVGLAPVVAEKGAGLVCERTPAGLARALDGLLADPGAARVMGEQGRRLAAEHFSWPAIASATRRVYESTIGRHVAAMPAELGYAGGGSRSGARQ